MFNKNVAIVFLSVAICSSNASFANTSVIKDNYAAVKKVVTDPEKMAQIIGVGAVIKAALELGKAVKYAVEKPEYSESGINIKKGSVKIAAFHLKKASLFAAIAFASAAAYDHLQRIKDVQNKSKPA